MPYDRCWATRFRSLDDDLRSSRLKAGRRLLSDRAYPAVGPSGARLRRILALLDVPAHLDGPAGRFEVVNIYWTLTNRSCVGERSFNNWSSKILKEKPSAEDIAVAVSPIIADHVSEAGPAVLKARMPRAAPARLVAGPILLTGRATGTTCGGAVTLRTETSETKSMHTDDSCSTKGRQGSTGCSIRMATLDTLVTVDLVTELLQPGSLRATLASLWVPNAERMAEATAAKVRCVANSSQLNRLMENSKDEPDR